MHCPTCNADGRKFGKDRYGNQRFQCVACRKTFSDRPVKPLGEMRLPLDKAVSVLALLTEGVSIRAIERLTGVAKNTVLALLEVVGLQVAAMMEERFVGLPVNNVEVDEVWGFIWCKEKRKATMYPENDELGDAYTYTAIERTNKLILAWHVGKRDAIETYAFMEKLNNATTGKYQLTTDGWRAYKSAVELFIDKPVDYAQLVKTYASPTERTGAARYSPPEVTGAEKICCQGTPDPDMICTSHVERSNLTIRMQVRRMTRLTNAFSKKLDNHRAAMAIQFAAYNFCRIHGTIKMTPAMAAGLTDHKWTLAELLEISSTH